MMLLLAMMAQEEILRSGSYGSVTAKKVIDALASLDANSLEKDPRVRLIEEAKGNIFVMKIDGHRVFFTRKDQDLVILSITNG